MRSGWTANADLGTFPDHAMVCWQTILEKRFLDKAAPSLLHSPKTYAVRMTGSGCKTRAVPPL
ncbi:MAG: hypothetical protein KC588_11165 [Nitrospira sp.]|nr:hypothetical protein [Nitrospira sp.]